MLRIPAPQISATKFVNETKTWFIAYRGKGEHLHSVDLQHLDSVHRARKTSVEFTDNWKFDLRRVFQCRRGMGLLDGHDAVVQDWWEQQRFL